MRNRYLDLLRAAAVVRVVVYHHFGWPWLSLVFPAMGVMFAVAGSLTAASLQKRDARKVVASRLRRVLPPLWALGVLAVPAMIGLGWAHLEPWKLIFWILPLGDPPGSEPATAAWETLWYIRAYVWFILLSPLLWRLYQRMGGAGWLLVIAPIAGLVALGKTGFSLPETADAAMWDLVTYGACWIAGFAHRDGRLARLSPGGAFGIAAVLGLLALYWQSGHQGAAPWDINDVPESQALWSLAFVLVVLRWQPDMTWLSRTRPLDRAVTLVNNRAVTVYLWHNLAIAAIWPVLEFAAMDDLGRAEAPVTLGVAFALTGVAVLLFGWVEDLAARRRPRLWPDHDAAPAPAAAAPVGPVPAGWPEVARDGTPVHGPEVGRDSTPLHGPAVGRDGTPVHGPDFPGTREMPVAGRPVPGYAPGGGYEYHRDGYQYHHRGGSPRDHS